MQFLCSDMNHSLKLVFFIAYDYLQEITKSNGGRYAISIACESSRFSWFFAADDVSRNIPRGE